MWASVQVWLRGPLFGNQDYNNLGILSMLLIILLSILALGLVIFHSRSAGIFFGLIVGVTYSLLFKISNLNLVGIFIAVLLFFHAEDLVLGEIKERIKMNSRILLRKGLVNFIVAFFVLISFAAYQSPAIEEFKNINQLPSSSQIFIKTIIEQTLGAQLDEATQEQKELVLNQATGEIMRQANAYLEPYFQYAPPALAFGLFLILWGVGWIFVLLSTGLGMILFWILKKINFFRIEEYDIKAQKITV